MKSDGISLMSCPMTCVFSLSPVHHIKGPLKYSHLPSMSHVPAIACAFALRECVSLVSQLFLAPHYLAPCPSMWCPTELVMVTINIVCTQHVGLHKQFNLNCSSISQTYQEIEMTSIWKEFFFICLQTFKNCVYWLRVGTSHAEPASECWYFPCRACFRLLVLPMQKKYLCVWP